MSTTDLAPLRDALGPAPAAATFQWPWDIASAGGQFFSQVSGVASALAGSASAVVTSPGGAGIVSGISGSPTNPSETNQMLNSGLFAPALNAVKADSLLRATFIGWSMGAQVGVFGGGGGSGVATDVVLSSSNASVTYGTFKLGIGAQITAGLLVGAMAREPAALNASTCVFEFGAGLLAAGTFVAVIMDDDLNLIGFTINIGAGGGVSTSTGYGSISAG
jgi:hypothetical protein